MKNEEDCSGEKDRDEADGENEDPVVGYSDVEVEGGENCTPQHQIQHLNSEIAIVLRFKIDFYLLRTFNYQVMFLIYT